MPPDPHPLPLKPVDFLILLVLAEGERHGYGIVRAIEERTGGRVSLVPGNLYAILRRLLEAGWLEEAETRPVPELEDRRRRYYRLTGLGRRMLSAEAELRRDLMRVAEERRLVRPARAR